MAARLAVGARLTATGPSYREGPYWQLLQEWVLGPPEAPKSYPTRARRPPGTASQWAPHRWPVSPPGPPPILGVGGGPGLRARVTISVGKPQPTALLLAGSPLRLVRSHVRQRPVTSNIL